MQIRNAVPILVFPLLMILVGFDFPVPDQGTPAPPSHPPQGNATAAPKSTDTKPPDNVPPSGSPSDASPRDESLVPPSDPCLPPDVKDWKELCVRQKENDLDADFKDARIIIRRESFRLILEGIRADGSSEEIYSTPVGLGDVNTQTPTGEFLINHVYCYPDVVLYDDRENKIPNVYKALLLPLLACDETGHCERFHELGIHGFDASAHPNRDRIRPEAFGPTSSGCIRVPDPCRFKLALVRLVGVGPLRKNERGCYHWLNKPVAVSIVDADDITVASLLKGGLLQVGKGLKGLLDMFDQ